MAKSTKAEAGYQGPEESPFKCAHCRHFVPPSSCTEVAGPIAPEGCCNFYEKAGKTKGAVRQYYSAAKA